MKQHHDRIQRLNRPQGLYLPEYEHDSCGVGFLCHLKGKKSNETVTRALEMLENMNHRGACGCEANSGDGAGILVKMPDKFFRREAKRLGINLPPEGQYAVGMLFLPKDLISRRECEQIFERTVREYGMVVLGWRDVPVDSSHVGPSPRAVEPRIRQVFVGMGETFYQRSDFDRRLYLVRQLAENRAEFGENLTQAARDSFYICILSANRTVYKGMLTAHQVRGYYKDLSDPDFQTSMAIVHSRFSTNTFPSWPLAHPYRYLAHNGEINTLRGNRNWMRARYGSLKSEIF
ncbi:MAG TPA: hypothetical protein VG722_07500, partial [Tepidisphaeraceae bacterium]|nr:hypothetical protein [Tepidisphaeraceae bacterium]